MKDLKDWNIGIMEGWKNGILEDWKEGVKWWVDLPGRRGEERET